MQIQVPTQIDVSVRRYENEKQQTFIKHHIWRLKHEQVTDDFTCLVILVVLRWQMADLQSILCFMFIVKVKASEKLIIE